MEKPKSSSNSGKRNKKFIITCLLVVLMGGIASLRYIYRPDFNFLRLEAKHIDDLARQKRIADAKEKLRITTSNSHARMVQIIKDTRVKTAGVIGPLKEHVPKLTSAVNEKLQGYGNAIVLVRRMAWDKLRGTHTTQDYLSEAFQPVVEAHSQAQAQLLRAFDDAVYKLKLESANLQASMAGLIGSENLKEVDLDMKETFNAFFIGTASQAFEAAEKTTAASVEVAIEAVLVKTTFETLSRLFAKAVAKEASSLAVGAAGAPIPGIDIITSVITVAGTAWTAYDVYEAVAEMKKVETEIRKGLDDSVIALEKKTDAAINDMEVSVASMFNNN